MTSLHESAFVDSFIREEKRERYIGLLVASGKRRKLLQRFHHNLDLAPDVATRIPGREQSAEHIEQVLRAKGASESCYVISANSDLDGQTMPLREALNTVVGFCSGTVLSCVPGRLGYYEAEDLGCRYILER